MKTIILTPDQIPSMWEGIKYAAVSAGYVEERFRPRFLNRLLYQLLSSKAQCFVRMDDERKLLTIMLTRVQIDEVRDENSLFIIALYSFVKVADEIWLRDLEMLKNYAREMDCKFIAGWSTNEKMDWLANMIGFKERFKSFVMEV